MKLFIFLSAIIFSFHVNGQHVRSLLYENGSVKSVQIMSGPEVMFTSYYENGSIKETGAYYKGKRHGNWMLFDDAGNKISVGNYSLGEK